MAAGAGRNTALDLARLVMSVLVMALHCDLWRDTAPMASFFLVGGLGRIGVPFFFVLTGYFLEREQGVRAGALLLRLGWLYLVWMAVYLPWSWPELAARPIWTAVFGYWHLWYLAALGPALAVLAVIRRLPVPVPVLLAGAAGFYLAGYAIQIGALGPLGLRDGYPIYRNALFDALPLLVIGAVMARRETALRRIPTFRLLVLAGLVAGLFLGEIALFWRQVPDAHVDLYLSILPATALVFLLVSRAQIIWRLPHVARLATAIYLIHPMVIMTLGPHIGGSGMLFAATLFLSTGMAAGLVWLNRHVTVL